MRIRETRTMMKARGYNNDNEDSDDSNNKDVGQGRGLGTMRDEIMRMMRIRRMRTMDGKHNAAANDDKDDNTYKKEDFVKLTPPQRKEVAVWTKANPSPGYAKGKKKEGGKGQNKSPKSGNQRFLR